MARYVPEGTVEVWWVATVADPAAPTTAELNAGVDITGSMTGDLVIPFAGSTVDAADMSSRFNKTAPGDYGGTEGSFSVHREKASGDDTAYTTLVRDAVGYFAVANRGLTTAGTWATSDEVDLWPAEILSRENQYGRGQTLKAGITFAITDEPTEDYSIAT